MKKYVLLLILAIITVPAVAEISKKSFNGETVVSTMPQVTLSTPQSAETGSIESGNLTLEISTPVDGTSVMQPSLKVAGKTKPKAEVFVNDAETVADGSGNFTTYVQLEEGDNYIDVMVTDEYGNSAERELSVILVTE